MLVKACHDALDIVLIERGKIALNQFFFSGHVSHLRAKLFMSAPRLTNFRANVHRDPEMGSALI